MSSKLWRRSLGERGLRVYLFERTPGGNLYREVYVGGERVAAKKSLRHRDRERAEADGYTLLAKLKAREEALQGGKLTLSALFDIYVVSAAHRAKKKRTLCEDEAKLQRVIRFLGSDRDVRSLVPSDIQSFQQARTRGQIGGRGKPVRSRTVAADLVAVVTMLNWACRERLLDANPLRGAKLPTEKNPRRPVETYDRYLRLMKVAEQVDWRLPAVLTLAESTGQRIGAILRLQRKDIELNRLPHGWIRFAGEIQKTGYEHSVALQDYARVVLAEHLGKLAAEPDTWLFPAERKPSQPVCVSAASRLLSEAYEKANLKKLLGGLWHPWRRKWATERKRMPRTDVAKAGGWRDTATLERCYQQADEATQMQVFLEAPKLYSEGVLPDEVTPNATPVSDGRDEGDVPQRQAG